MQASKPIEIFIKIWYYFKRLVFYFLVSSIGSVIFFSVVPIPFTPLMLQRSGEQLLSGKPLTLQKDWTSIENINPNMILAVVCAEDQRFESHLGFDFKAIEKAISSNKKLKKRGKSIKGASTISQQTAKNVFLLPARSWIRKGFEVYFTVLIELFWSKKRIMEVYLNIAEMGNGIYGVEAASTYFFKTTAIHLKPSQAAVLAAILPNPRVYNASKPSAYVVKRRNWIMRQMNNFGGTIDLNR